MNPSPSDFLTTAQAAAILGVSERQVRRLVVIGELQNYSPGRGRLLGRAEVEAYQRRPRGNPHLREHGRLTAE